MTTRRSTQQEKINWLKANKEAWEGFPDCWAAVDAVEWFGRMDILIRTMIVNGLYSRKTLGSIFPSTIIKLINKARKEIKDESQGGV